MLKKDKKKKEKKRKGRINDKEDAENVYPSNIVLDFVLI